MENKIKPIIEEELYCLVAADGTPQPSSLGEDLIQSMAFMYMLKEAGMGMSLDELKRKGFTFEKVIVTIVQAKSPDNG